MAWIDQAPWLACSAVILLTLAALRFLPGYTPDQSQARLWQTLDAIGPRATEGYTKFCKAQNLPFILPSLWAGRAVVVLPPSLLPLLNRQNSELAAHGPQSDTIQLPYMMSDTDVYHNPIQYDVARRNRSRRDIGAIAAATSEELHAAFLAFWVADGNEWAELNNWDACGIVLAKASHQAAACREYQGAAVRKGTATSLDNYNPPNQRYDLSAQVLRAHAMLPTAWLRRQIWKSYVYLSE
ncbi:uncharacterized protein JN550_000406 [Neoarthrinium moseri]|uniref:uncharacterized protein n=1 Tax=Neoarthrinium moseri TaxID=1658444 RepID=UPI001FDE0CBE|nr:uncharacterized protein JN550_000406 [Neoarthrinium moseri]KAI1878224.1 hypothetical protein JN550_000406 [Neoarthrinium moseri]